MLVPQRVQRFWTSVPRPLMEQVLRSLCDNYLLADQKCGDFEKAEKSNLLPFYRRALIERSLRAIAKRYPGQVTAEAVQHEEKGFWYHTRIIFGGDVALTQNTVPHSNALVRNSSFRNCYAGERNQLWLIPEVAPPEAPAGSLLYGILLHGRSPESHLFPGFAQVRLPKPELNGYFSAKIDLFDEFPEVVEEKTTGLPGPLPTETELEPEFLDPTELPEGDDYGSARLGA
jgi:hypothetical protein